MFSGYPYLWTSPFQFVFRGSTHPHLKFFHVFATFFHVQIQEQWLVQRVQRAHLSGGSALSQPDFVGLLTVGGTRHLDLREVQREVFVSNGHWLVIYSDL